MFFVFFDVLEMYDKVKLEVPLEAGGAPPLSFWEGLLENVSEKTRKDTGECSIFGHCLNMKVDVYAGKVVLEGSWSKWLNGNNLKNTTLADDRMALEKLSDVFHIDAATGKVSNIEFGYNFTLKHAVPQYVTYLGDLPRYTRFPASDSAVYYKRNAIRPQTGLVFYDKIREMKKYKEPYAEAGNVLRYELKILRNVSDVLKWKPAEGFTAATLVDEGCYNRAKTIWKDNYMKINKTCRRNLVKKVTRKNVFFSIFGKYLLEKGGNEEIQTQMTALKASGQLDARTLRGLCQDFRHALQLAEANTEDVMKELDDMIRDV